MQLLQLLQQNVLLAASWHALDHLSKPTKGIVNAFHLKLHHCNPHCHGTQGFVIYAEVYTANGSHNVQQHIFVIFRKPAVASVT